MIDKLVVLFAVENFKQGRGRITLIISGKLVYLVKDQYGIVDSCVLYRSNDPAGNGTDVCSSVTPDLSLILDAAQGNALAFSADRLCYRLCDRGLADTRRTDKTDYLSFLLVAEFFNRKLLDYPVLDFFKPVMAFIQIFADF